MNLDNNLQRIAQSFSKAATSYQEHAHVQQDMGQQLLSLLEEHSDFISLQTVNSVLEIGCGPGNFTQKLLQLSSVQQLLLNDISPKMLQQALVNVQASNSACNVHQLVSTKTSSAVDYKIDEAVHNQLDIVAKNAEQKSVEQKSTELKTAEPILGTLAKVNEPKFEILHSDSKRPRPSFAATSLHTSSGSGSDSVSTSDLVATLGSNSALTSALATTSSTPKIQAKTILCQEDLALAKLPHAVPAQAKVQDNVDCKLNHSKISTEHSFALAQNAAFADRGNLELEAETRDRALHITPLCGDILHLMQQQILPKVDLIVSNAVLQWLPLEQVLQQCSKVSNYIAFSSFCLGNFQEFATLGLPSLNYLSLEQIHTILQKNTLKFKLSSQTYHQYFASVSDLMHHLKATGVNGVEHQALSAGKLRSIMRKYAYYYHKTHGIVLTWCPYFVIAKLA